MARWETIYGTSHVVGTSPLDRELYAGFRPGDRVVRLEAEAGGSRYGFTFTIDATAARQWTDPFPRFMARAVRELEKAGVR